MKKTIRVLLALVLMASFVAAISGTANAQTGSSYSFQEECEDDGFVVTGSAKDEALGYTLIVIEVDFKLGSVTETRYDLSSWGGSTSVLPFVSAERAYNIYLAFIDVGDGQTLIDPLDGTGSSGIVLNGMTGDECSNTHPPTSTDLVTLVDPTQGEWHLFNASGVETSSFFFGNPGDYPIMGDWDGDGVATPGMYRQSDGYVYLRNSNTQGVADIRFFFGNPGDVPIVGDFDGDGFDTVGIYRPSNQTFYIINELGANEGGLGAAEFSYVFGDPGDKPFVGDFDGDGIDTVGLHRESTGLVYFRNSHSQGNADAQFIFGDPGDRLVAGDWNSNGASSPALFRPGNMTMYFRYTNTQGNADNSWTAGMPSWLPVAGGR